MRLLCGCCVVVVRCCEVLCGCCVVVVRCCVVVVWLL